MDHCKSQEYISKIIGSLQIPRIHLQRDTTDLMGLLVQCELVFCKRQHCTSAAQDSNSSEPAIAEFMQCKVLRISNMKGRNNKMPSMPVLRNFMLRTQSHTNKISQHFRSHAVILMLILSTLCYYSSCQQNLSNKFVCCTVPVMTQQTCTTYIGLTATPPKWYTSVPFGSCL